MSEDAKRFCIPFKLLRDAVTKLNNLVDQTPEEHYIVIQVGYSEPHTSNAYYVYIVDDIKVLTGEISSRGRVLGPDDLYNEP